MSTARLALLRWLPIAATATLLAFTHSGAPAQPTAAQAAAEGRTAISGAQGGPGGQPGLAQGGLGVQGATAAQIEVPLRRPGKVVRAEDLKPEGPVGTERTLSLVGPSIPDRSEPLPKKGDEAPN